MNLIYDRKSLLLVKFDPLHTNDQNFIKINKIKNLRKYITVKN